MPNENPQHTSEAAPSFEQALTQLETIVHQLEDGEVGLADALECYEAGVRLLKQCHALLARAERRIELLSGVDAQGNPITEPFDDEASLSLEAKGEPRKTRRKKPAPKTPAEGCEGGESSTGNYSSDIDEPGSLF